MTSPKKTSARKLETFEHAMKRYLRQVKGRTKTAATDEQLARALTKADYQRGLVAAPVTTSPQGQIGR